MKRSRSATAPLPRRAAKLASGRCTCAAQRSFCTPRIRGGPLLLSKQRAPQVRGSHVRRTATAGTAGTHHLHMHAASLCLCGAQSTQPAKARGVSEVAVDMVGEVRDVDGGVHQVVVLGERIPGPRDTNPSRLPRPPWSSGVALIHMRDCRRAPTCRRLGATDPYSRCSRGTSPTASLRLDTDAATSGMSKTSPPEDPCP